MEIGELIINEVQVGLILKTTENAMSTRYGKNEMVHRTDMCEFSAEIARYKAMEYGFDANMYNIANINTARGVSPSDTFTHQVTIAQKGQSIYLLEPSFVQFADGKKGVLAYKPWIETDHKISNPLAQRLIKRRFVKLDNQTFNDYLNLTSVGDQKEVGLDLLQKVTPEIPKMTLQDAQMFGVK